MVLIMKFSLGNCVILLIFILTGELETLAVYTAGNVSSKYFFQPASPYVKGSSVQGSSVPSYTTFPKNTFSTTSLTCSAKAYISCTNGDVQFYLRTSANQNEQKLSSQSITSLKIAQFLPGVPIKVIIHGLNETRNDILITALVEELLNKRGGMNVILVDYGLLAMQNCYMNAVKNTPVISKCLVQLVEAIVKNRPELSINDFHFIGFSLGAQIAGQMYRFKNKSIVFSRITGIDPAAPGFYTSYSTSSEILDRGDAHFVDIIHGNSGILGKFLPIGNVDFFANSGVFQGGCPANYVNCSHARPVLLYTESVNENISLEAYKCPYIESFYVSGCFGRQYVTFGDYIDTSMRGIYFFRTNSRPPYIGSVKLQYQVFNEQEGIADIAESQGLM